MLLPAGDSDTSLGGLHLQIAKEDVIRAVGVANNEVVGPRHKAT